MEKFPALALVLHYGSTGAIASAVLAATLTVLLLWSVAGWLGVLIAVLVGAAVYLAAKCCVELITIVTEMLVPR